MHAEGPRTHLPIPPRPLEGDLPFDARDPRAVFPPIEELRPPAGAPNVIVVLLDDVVNGFQRVRRANPDRDPAKPTVYVGMTGLDPAERFANHKRGIKCSFLVRHYGLDLIPALYAHLNPMPYEAAVQMERDLAEDLRREGYAVMGGH